MIPPQSLLVPTDFSETAELALDYAVALAEKLGATVHLVHAYELPLVALPEVARVLTPEMTTHMSNAAQAALDALVSKYTSRAVKIHAFLEQADPRTGVLAAAKKVDADLIIMGTHGRHGIARALMGSVTERVVRTSAIPVLTIRTPDTKP